MAFLLLVGAFGAGIGFLLGVLATVVCRASDASKLATQRACAYPQSACLVARDAGNTA